MDLSRKEPAEASPNPGGRQDYATLYLQSIYEFFRPLRHHQESFQDPMSVHIGDFLPESWRETHLTHFPEGAFLITACNPRSQWLSEVENHRRMEALRGQIETRGWIHWPARGRDVESSWVEPSFLVFGATYDEIRLVMAQWDQHAWIWIDRAGLVRLCWINAPKPGNSITLAD